MNKDKGWISLYRQFIDWEWYDDANTMRLFIHCLLSANYEDKKWRGKLIKRGSFITSLSKLAYSLKLSKMQIRNTLTKLKTTGEITHLATPEYSIITVKNYDLYQNDNTRKNTRRNAEQHTSNTRVTPTNNINKREIINNLSLCEREILKKYLLSRPRKEPIYDFDAYIALLEKNGTIEKKLELAKKWHEKTSKNGVIQKLETTEDKAITDEAKAKARAKVLELRKSERKKG